jgi:lipopolysaccharide transport system permease protein
MDITREVEPAFRSTAVRPGPVGSVVEGFREVWSRRRLIGYLVRADLRKKGADTFLGNVWWVVDPLLQMLVYVVLVDFIFRRNVPDYPLFIFAAILPWKWFTSSVYDAVTSVVGQERLIKQIHFPKLVLPVASTFAGIANFAFGLIPLAVLLLLFFSSRITPQLIWIPAIAAVQLVFTLGCCFLVAAINVFFRDLGNIVRHALRLWFYLSPALYSVAHVQEVAPDNTAIQFAINLNPWTWIFESYRNVIYAGVPPYWGQLAVVLVGSLVFLALTTILFKRLEPGFAKVL